MPRIFIDPGHGGHDPGASGNGLVEKVIALDIAKQIQAILTDYQNVKVKMSRSDDRYLTLTERTNLANNWGANYFVAIHLNSGSGNGYEDYIYNGGISAPTIGYQQLMNKHIVAATGFFNRGMKRADFTVLRQSKMPAILTENGFVDNMNDAKLLKDPYFITKIAQGHVNGLVNIFGLQKKEEVIMPEKDEPSIWAKDAQKWVKEMGISDGTNPYKQATREEVWSMLYRMSKNKK